MRALAQGGSNAVGGLARHAGTVVGEGWVKPNRRIFDNKKVSDHFAIIPTLQIPHDLSEAEGKLRPGAQALPGGVLPAAEYRVTTRMTEVQGHRFRTDGKVLVAPAGWPSTARKPRARTPTWCRWPTARPCAPRTSKPWA